jgi:hypothetical protein
MAAWQHGVVSSKTAARRAWHLVQGAFVLLPTGTPYRGAPKYDAIGKVHRVLKRLLTQAGRTGRVARGMAKASKRLTAWVETQRLAAG